MADPKRRWKRIPLDTKTGMPPELLDAVRRLYPGGLPEPPTRDGVLDKCRVDRDDPIAVAWFDALLAEAARQFAVDDGVDPAQLTRLAKNTETALDALTARLRDFRAQLGACTTPGAEAAHGTSQTR